MKVLAKQVREILATLFMLTILFCHQAAAQEIEPCGTSEDDQWTSFQYLDNDFDKMPNVILEIPVKFHFVGANNGLLTIDSLTVAKAFDIVNAQYLAGDIQFVQCGSINYIKDNDYINFIKYTDEDLCDVHDVEGAINVYFVPTLDNQDNEGLCGYAYNFDIKRRLFMQNSCVNNTSTFAHEFGHSLSLLHTHSTSNGKEYVNGTNCSVAGDLICETPADPNLSDWVSNDCQYTGNLVDPLGTLYAPDVTNIMSYANSDCRYLFQQEQFTRMYNFAIANIDLLNCNMNTPNEKLESSKQRVLVYPNPTNGILFLKSDFALVKVDVFNLLGQKVISIDFHNNEKDDLSLDLSGQPNGAYWINYYNNHKINTFKIIKNN